VLLKPKLNVRRLNLIVWFSASARRRLVKQSSETPVRAAADANTEKRRRGWFPVGAGLYNQ